MLKQHLEAKHWLFEGESNSQVHLQSYISWNTPFQLLLSTNTTSLFTVSLNNLPNLIILTIPLRPMKCLKLKMKESVLYKWTISICIALLERQVYKASYFLTSFWQSFTTNDPKISTPQYVNSGSIHILSFGKSAIFCCWSCPLNCLHLTHSPIIDCTNELQLMIQKPEDLIWLMVITRPACATLLGHHHIIKSAVWQDFSNKIGCWTSPDMSHFPILPPTLNIPSWSKNGSDFIILDDDFREFPLCNAIISSLKCLCWTDLFTCFSALFSSSKISLQLMVLAPF